MIAGYFSGYLADFEVPENQSAKSLIISVDNNQNYKVLPEKRMKGVVYDKQYIIFGNAEIRVRFG